MEKGYVNITILEAENRIGGRIHTIPFADKFIDLGAQYVHGEKNNAIYELVNNSFNLGSDDSNKWNVTYLISNGSLADQKQCMRISELGDQIIQESEEGERDYEESLGTYFLKRFRARLSDSENSDIDQTLADLITESKHKESSGYYGAPSWYDISVQVNAQYEYAEGNQHLTWTDKGYATVFDYITVRCSC